jgi:hypothetical protein
VDVVAELVVELVAELVEDAAKEAVAALADPAAIPAPAHAKVAHQSAAMTDVRMFGAMRIVLAGLRQTRPRRFGTPVLRSGWSISAALVRGQRRNVRQRFPGRRVHCASC